MQPTELMCLLTDAAEESREKGLLTSLSESDQKLAYGEAITYLESLHYVDLESLGIPDPDASMRALADFLDDTNENIYPESRSAQDFPIAVLNRIVLQILYAPELHRREWGWVEGGAVIDQVVWSQKVDAFILEISQKRARDKALAELSVDDLTRIVSVPRLLTAEQIETLNKTGLAAFIHQIAASKELGDNWAEISERLEEYKAGHGHTYRDQQQNSHNISRIFGLMNSLVIKAYLEEVTLETKGIVQELQTAFQKGYLPSSTQTDAVLSDSERVLFFSKVGLPEAGTQIRLVTLNPEWLQQQVTNHLREKEGRYVGSEHIDTSFFVKHARTENVRHVPVFNDSLTDHQKRALTQSEWESLPASEQALYQAMPSLQLFYKQTAKDLEEFNRRIDAALKTGEPLTIFIPTCPTDQHTMLSSQLIKYSDGPLVPGISWTGLNTIDGLEVLVPYLSGLGVNVRIQMATGDIEYFSGNTRGMNQADFMDVLDQSQENIAGELIKRLGNLGTVERLNQATAEEALQQRLVLITTAAGNQIQIEINGIAQLAGGKDGWEEIKNQVGDLTTEFLENPNNSESIARVIKARTTLYTIRSKNRLLADQTRRADDIAELIDLLDRRKDADEGDPLDPKLFELFLQELSADIGDYVAFHTLAQQINNPDHTIVMAGDSYPLESLAASIAQTGFLLAVHGNYDGSIFITTEA